MKQIRPHKRMQMLLPLLVLSLTGCVASLPIVPPSPMLPAPPPVTTPQPLQPYSQSVLQDLQKWQKMLTDTPLIPEPTNSPSQGK